VKHFCFFALALIGPVPVNAVAAEPVALSGRAMGTHWSVKFAQPESPLRPDVVQQQVAERLEQLEQMFSTFRTQSEVSRFNDFDDVAWFSVAPEMTQVAEQSRKISALTAGAFDVTVYPLVRLWGFGPVRRSGSMPTGAEIVSTRAFVDWRRLEVRANPPALRKLRRDVQVDFSSMAKGFAADAVSALLTRLGAEHHLVQVGGDVKSGVSGKDDTGWHAAIEQPLDDQRAIACVLELKGQGLSTSGDYRNFFQIGRQRYGHIIDPRTGQPPTSSLASVSVVHASCAQSSALATALFVLGPDEGYRLADAQGFACLFLVRSGTGLVHRATPEFEKLVQADR
jgi:FAD:protein FMN transferase